VSICSVTGLGCAVADVRTVAFLFVAVLVVAAVAMVLLSLRGR
jgi:hypothetical protein